MYTTCIIWLAFVPIYFGTGNSFEVLLLYSTTATIKVIYKTINALVSLYCVEYDSTIRGVCTQE